MQLVTRKIGPVTFEHQDEFKGEVKITKGDASLSVSMEALRELVAESVRFEGIRKLSGMKTADLLKKLA